MKTSLLLPHLEALGARIGVRPEHPESPCVLTFGDVPGEYEAAQEDCILLDQTDRTRVSAKGPEAAAFLHRMLANDVRGLQPGACNRNLLLTSKGKIRYDFELLVGEDQLELLCPAGMASGLQAALDMYLFTEDLTLEETSEQHAPLALIGPRAMERAGQVLGQPVELQLGQSLMTSQGVRVTCQSIDGLEGLLIDAKPDGAQALWDQLTASGAKPSGVVMRDILRVEACAPLFGMDLDENVYPQEGLIEQAFSLEKGCYVGQEVVAKIDTYGGMNKRLCLLKVDDDDPVQRGTRLMKGQGDEARDIGMVTSWAYSFIHDTGLVLAYVKKRNQEPGTSFSLGERKGSATILATDHEPSGA